MPETTTVSVGSGAVPGGLTQVTQSVIVEPRGATRLPDAFSLDLSVRKPILSTWTFEPRLDFYNLTNKATIPNWLTTLGSTDHRASTIQQGRMIKVGLSVEL